MSAMSPDQLLLQLPTMPLHQIHQQRRYRRHAAEFLGTLEDAAVQEFLRSHLSL